MCQLHVAGALEEGREGKLKDDLSEKSRHQLKHRELFLSRQVETLPATHIRGKCAVTLLNETESLQSYLNKDVRSFCQLLIYISLKPLIEYVKSGFVYMTVTGNNFVLHKALFVYHTLDCS